MTNLLLRFFVFISVTKIAPSFADARLDDSLLNVDRGTNPAISTCSIDHNDGNYLTAEWLDSCSFNSSELNDIANSPHNSGQTVAEQKNLPFMAMVYARIGAQKCFGSYELVKKENKYSFVRSKNKTCIESIEHYPLTSAAVIHPQILLTTAHHFINSTVPMYLVGSGSDNLEQQQITQVERVVVHPRYDYSSSLNDIALVKLTSELSSALLPMCVCPVVPHHKIDSLQMKIAGWSVGGGRIRTQLLRENVTPNHRLSMSKCCKAHRMERSECSGTKEYDNFACVKSVSRKRTCDGKLAQVLYQNLPSGNAVLRGISVATIAGFNCKRKSPLVFVNLRLHQEWILKQMHELLNSSDSAISPKKETINDSEIILPGTVPDDN